MDNRKKESGIISAQARQIYDDLPYRQFDDCFLNENEPPVQGSVSFYKKLLLLCSRFWSKK